LGLSILKGCMGVGEKISFHLSFCSKHVPSTLFSSSQWVPIRFTMCSPKVFLIGTHFNPIYFGQSHPLLTYMTRPKGRHSIFGQDVVIQGGSIV
jgi:hypothetical protein